MVAHTRVHNIKLVSKVARIRVLCNHLYSFAKSAIDSAAILKYIVHHLDFMPFPSFPSSSSFAHFWLRISINFGSGLCECFRFLLFPLLLPRDLPLRKGSWVIHGPVSAYDCEADCDIESEDSKLKSKAPKSVAESINNRPRLKYGRQKGRSNF